jgi:AP-3 complex subunit beta
MRGEGFLPDWLEQGIESSLRDTEDDNPPLALPVHLSAQRSIGTPVNLTPVDTMSAMQSSSGTKIWTDLDKFYEEEEEEESDTDDESNEGTESQGESEDDESSDGSGYKEHQPQNST